MKRRRILLLLALAAVVGAAGLILCWPRGPKEPVYEGKPLSQWIDEAYIGEYIGDDSGNREIRETTRRALKAMGTNALPWLLFQFARQDPRWMAGLKQWAYSHRMMSRQFQAEQRRLYTINYGLHLLGPDAAPGLPVLAKYLDSWPRGDMAASVMENCGTSALPYLVKAMDSTNDAVWGLAFRVILRLPGETNFVLPTLVRLTNHSNEWVRWSSVHELANHRSHPDLVVPPLVRALSDPDPVVRYAAIDLLGGLGKDAKSAIPELLRLMDPASQSRFVASNAVLRIDPAALPARGP